jgi:hypothetical protein
VTGQLRVHRSITGEFFTATHRVTGRVSFSGLGLISVLGDSTRTAIMIEDAYIARIAQPSEIISHRAQIHIPKTSLDLMVFGKSENTGLDIMRTNIARSSRHKVFIITNTFEMRGQIDTTGTFDPELFLTKLASVYIPIMNVEAHAQFLPKAVYSGEVAFVNRPHIHVITSDE